MWSCTVEAMCCSETYHTTRCCNPEDDNICSCARADLHVMLMLQLVTVRWLICDFHLPVLTWCHGPILLTLVFYVLVADYLCVLPYTECVLTILGKSIMGFAFGSEAFRPGKLTSADWE
jgi:hypothetical protein